MRAIREEIKSPIEWVKYTASAIVVTFLIALVFPVASGILEEFYTPRSYWFTYEKIEVRDSVPIGSSFITVYSTRTTERAIDFQWSDSLFCDLYDGAGMAEFDTQTDFRLGVNDPVKPYTGAWRYNGAIPNQPARCEFISTSCAQLQYTKKCQTIKSNKFYIE